ncbi:hypothetical protein CW304_20910 [Bacillus sp. UFRGS-B20]|nr:hypothetical protein CW304_20910 [Bacillus sp. UFRGS-B20]
MICLQDFDTFYVMPISTRFTRNYRCTGEKWAKQMQGFLAQAVQSKQAIQRILPKRGAKTNLGYHLSNLY